MRVAVARGSAAVIAAAAWGGLGVDLAVSYGRTGSLAVSLWAMLRFFTILTNLAVAGAFMALAVGLLRDLDPRLAAGLSLSIMLVGVVFRLLLEGPTPAGLGSILLHRVTPIAVPAYWLAFVPKGRLRWVDPPLWTLYPLAYLGYVLLRGQADGRYPYPFLDVARIGWGQMTTNALAIGSSFLVTGLFAVWADHILGRVRRRAA